MGRKTFFFWQVLVVCLVLWPGLAIASLTVPAYDSLPGSSHTLYLNFGGIDYSGTWSGYTPGTVPAYDVSGNPSTFDATELANIAEIWGRVAEMYSPFNVNITTVAPPGTIPVADQWSQIVIGAGNASGVDWYGNFGGVAMLNGFKKGGQQDGTGWAFTNHLGNGNPKYTAILCAHESGHQFGLSHQSQYDENGSYVTEYRPSTDGNLTAPIMGDGYDATRALWSSGTRYSETDLQRDRSILVGTLGYRPDDNNHDIAHAKSLTVTGGTSVLASGIIKQPTENDLYSFTTAAGLLTLNVLPYSFGGMLDAQLLLYRQDGTLLETIDPPLTPSGPDYGLSATFSGYLDAGTYYLDVTSHGSYGDVGQYTVTGTLATVPEPGVLAMLLGTALMSLAWCVRKRFSHAK